MVLDQSRGIANNKLVLEKPDRAPYPTETSMASRARFQTLLPIIVALACGGLGGCGTGAYDDLMRQSMSGMADQAAIGSDAVANATPDNNRGGQAGQVLGGNRQSFLGQPLNAAMRVVAQNKLRNVATNVLSAESTDRRFPPQAIYGSDGTPLLSWRVALLQQTDPNLYRLFKLDEAWDSENNQPLVARMPDDYDIGYDLPEGHTAILAIVGDDTVIARSGKGDRMAGITDGPQNTIMFVIASSEAAVPWTKPADIDYDPSDPLKNVVGGDNTFMAAFADGTVVRVQNVEPEIVAPFFTKSGGEAVRTSDLQ